eukprot:c7452_g1_i3.p1 GENE.c7452_g1_i3~~c7452_g1_i3.p1  ORF type:complete len:251 (+),score=49.76 c7452_g1_i3:146-898(+)
MVLGMSLTQFVVTIAFGVAVIGPKEIPKAARFLGELVGHTVVFAKRARNTALKMGNSEMSELHRELQEGLAEINAIRSEFRQNISVSSNISRAIGSSFNPAPQDAQSTQSQTTTTESPTTNLQAVVAQQTQSHSFVSQSSLYPPSSAVIAESMFSTPPPNSTIKTPTRISTTSRAAFDIAGDARLPEDAFKYVAAAIAPKGTNLKTENLRSGADHLLESVAFKFYTSQVSAIEKHVNSIFQAPATPPSSK